MKLSLSWLKEYADLKYTNKEIADRLTMSGSKVEGFEYLGEKLDRVVVGKILAVDKHPDADKLVICAVDVGKEQVQIVTGATNVFPGALVPVALDGSTLPCGLNIKAGKLRGQVSQGMLCSIEELGVTLNDCPGADPDGILILTDVQPGQDMKQVLGLDDWVFEFEITPNRPDCLSAIGLGREACATFDQTFIATEPKFETDGKGIDGYLKVEVSDKAKCTRYAAAMVYDVKIQPSPAWLRHRLHACGVRPINNIVDITNYVMLEYGQPMHAFDYSCLNSGEIVVRCAAPDEKFVTLDEQEHKLDDQMLVIADKTRAVALAGVMGGQNSEIKDTTTTIVFESANFSGPSVRVTAQKLGMRTDSSSRFEKGLDPQNTVSALKRACQLVKELGAGKVMDGIIDKDYSDKTVTTLPLVPSAINKLLGTGIKKDKMVQILTRLGFTVKDDIIKVPSYRGDVKCAADIAEEIARIYGYNNLPTSLFAGSVTAGALTPEQQLKQKISQLCRGLGYSESLTYSFISPKGFDNILLPSDSSLREYLTILNPLGEDTSVMRTTMLPSMLEILSRNKKVRNESALIFELGTTYQPAFDEQGKVDQNVLPKEKTTLALAAYAAGYSFFAMKGALEALFASLKLTDIEYKAINDNPSYHPGRCACIYKEDVQIGVFGQLNPLAAKNYGISGEAYAAELDFDAVNQLVQADISYSPLPKFPAMTRDIAVVCDREIPVAQLMQIIKRAVKNNLEQVKLFDVYTGEQIEADKKSVAFSLVLRASDRTLTDAEADSAVKKILKALEMQANAILR